MARGVLPRGLPFMATHSYLRSNVILVPNDSFGMRYLTGYQVEEWNRSGFKCKKLGPGETRPPTYYDRYSISNSVPENVKKDKYGDNIFPGFISNWMGRGVVSGNYLAPSGNPIGTYCQQAYSKAYSKMMDQILGRGDDAPGAASLGVSIAEGREAIAGIVERSTRLFRSYKALRSGRFKEFLRQLGGRPKEKHKHTRWTRPKDASSLWLEYWLAWAPLAGDIRASTGVLASSDFFPAEHFTARSAVHLNVPSGTSGGLKQSVTTEVGYCSVAFGYRVKIVNHNAYLAARLGLDAPAQIAWAVVPFSFVVDWFANIGQILGAMDFRNLGIELSEKWVSSNTVVYSSTQWSTGSTSGYDQTRWTSWENGVRSVRLVNQSFAVPSLVVKWPDGLSPTRGATAISLLVSLFTKG